MQALPRIVLLPGMDGTARLLKDVSWGLGRTFRVTAIAYPVDTPLAYDALVSFVLDRLPSEAFVLLGESFSGPIAIEIAARRSALLRGLVLVSTFSRLPFPATLAPLARLSNPRWLPRTIVNAALLGPYGSPALRRELGDVLESVSPSVLTHRLISALQVDVTHRLAEIACPVLCLVGSRDRLLDRRTNAALSSGIAGCVVETIEAPHMLLETHAEAAAAAIERFFRTLVV